MSKNSEVIDAAQAIVDAIGQMAPKEREQAVTEDFGKQYNKIQAEAARLCPNASLMPAPVRIDTIRYSFSSTVVAVLSRFASVWQVVLTINLPVGMGPPGGKMDEPKI